MCRSNRHRFSTAGACFARRAPNVAAASVFSRFFARSSVFASRVKRARAALSPFAAAAGPKGLIRSGENGVLVPIDDVAALSAAMRQVLQDKEFRQRIVAGARVEFDARFTEQAVVGQYRAFYADCLKGSSA